MSRKSVDLPQPEGPTMATNSSRSTASDTSRRATTSSPSSGRNTSSTCRSSITTRGLFLSHGDFYAATVVERLGLGDEGLVRAGCACYTTEDEIDRLIEGVREIANT